MTILFPLPLQVNQELGEIGGVFVSKQPSDTDMGAKEPKTDGWEQCDGNLNGLVLHAIPAFLPSLFMARCLDLPVAQEWSQYRIDELLICRKYIPISSQSF